jgi:hypothetical protein
MKRCRCAAPMLATPRYHGQRGPFARAEEGGRKYRRQKIEVLTSCQRWNGQRQLASHARSSRGKAQFYRRAFPRVVPHANVHLNNASRSKARWPSDTANGRSALPDHIGVIILASSWGLKVVPGVL